MSDGKIMFFKVHLTHLSSLLYVVQAVIYIYSFAKWKKIYLFHIEKKRIQLLWNFFSRAGKSNYNRYFESRCAFNCIQTRSKFSKKHSISQVGDHFKKGNHKQIQNNNKQTPHKIAIQRGKLNVVFVWVDGLFIFCCTFCVVFLRATKSLMNYYKAQARSRSNDVKL